MEGHLTLEQLGYSITRLDTTSVSFEPKSVGRPWEPYKIVPIQVSYYYYFGLPNVLFVTR
jgi:hypothetical protein